MSALIGALRVSLSADTANFEAGMKRAQRTTQASASAMSKSLGLVKVGLASFASALSVGLLTRAVGAALEYAGSLAEVAQQLGVTTKDLQVFRFAAGQVGVSQEQLETGLSKLTITLGKVAAGAKAPTAALNAIGISADQLKGKNTGEAFRIIADGLQKVTDRSQRAAVEVALFSKSGAMLDNLLSGGSAAINELSLAAEKLGIVLSDEQIQNADDTADKLEALKTVLSARIAGVVADNAASILGLANALVELIGKLGTALRAYRAFVAEMNRLGGKLKALDPTNTSAGQAEGRLQIAVAESELRDLQRQQAGGTSAEERAARFRRGLGMNAPKPVPAGADIGKFLAGGGGSKKAKKGREDHSAEDALRNAHQFDQELRRAQMDVLRATQDLATDYVERTSIGVQILDAEKAAFEAEIQYERAMFDLTKGKDGLSKVQADQLTIEYQKKDALERQKLLDEEAARRKEEFNHLNDLTFDLQRDKLQSEQQIATTAKEQRDIQLRLLDLSYRQERARLEAVLADEKAGYAAQEEARRRLANLQTTYGNDRQAVINNTPGPMEDYFSQVPKTAAEAQEAMERMKVMGIDAAVNGLVALSQNFENWRDIALNAIQQVLAELLRMQLMKLAFNLIGSAAGGGGGLGASLFPVSGGVDPLAPLPGYASGGSMLLGGLGGIDRNVLSMNGLPIAKVSRGEMLNITPQRGGGGNPVHIHMSGPMTDAQARKTGMQAAAGYRSEMARSSSKGIS